MQVFADAAQGLIVDVEVVQDPQDAQQLAPAMERLRESLSRYPQQALAESGYTNNESIVAMAETGIDYYGVMTGRTDKPKVIRGHLKTVRVLLDQKADLTVRAPDGRSLLQAAQEKGYGRIFDLLTTTRIEA